MASKLKSKKKYYEPKESFIKRMQQLLPNENDFQEYMKIIKVELPRSIRCNTLKISPEKLKSRLEKNYNWIIKQPFKDFPEIMIIEGKKSNDNKPNNQSSNPPNLSQNFSSINNLPREKSWQSPIWNEIDKRTEGELIVPLNPGELGRSLEHMLGYYYIQEIASMLPVLALNPKPNETILDLCASPGSKTTQIASRMQNTGTLIANEVSQGRINILSANLSRCGCTNVIITKKDGMMLCKELGGMNNNPKTQSIKKSFSINNLSAKTSDFTSGTSKLCLSEVASNDEVDFEANNIASLRALSFDKILVDAPCSGEGTIRSTPATNKMWNPKTITRLSKIQKNLVAAALKILKPGGTLIYSTCTHAPEENEAILDYIKKEFDVEIEPVASSLPKELKCREGITEWEDEKYNEEIKNACRIYPQDNNTEGFFIAKIKKLGN